MDATRNATRPRRTTTDRFHAFVERVASPASSSGALAGLRLAVKDLVDVVGRAPTLGLASPPDPAPSRTAPVLQHLIDSGAQLVGFTHMTALAYEPSGSNPAQGRPLNPWDGDRICGGSSSGSAVAVASGQADVALGSDTAGSVRIPAHCCGLSAWKPSAGIVPSDGTMPLAPSLDTIGFIARNAEILLRVATIFAATPAAPAIARIAIAADLRDDSPAATAEALDATAKALADSGYAILDTALGDLIAACDAPVLDLLQGEAAACHAGHLAAATVDPLLARRLKKGASIDAAQLESARLGLRTLSGAALDAAFADADAILLPVMPLTTPSVGECELESPGFSPRTLYALSAWTRFVNGLGLPAIALSCGVDIDGMPIGLQLVGRHGSDLALLAVADVLQRSTDWHLRSAPGAEA